MGTKIPSKKKKILIVDDEKDIVELLSHSLQREGYDALPAYTGEEALELIKTKKPHLVILDLMLPGIQGLEVCRQIRANPEYSTMPVLVLSAKSSEVDRILGLEMGADDYITKPFSPRELMARVSVAFRRLNSTKEKMDQKGVISCKGLVLNFDRHEFTAGGKRIELTPIETKLLFFLAKNPGRVHTRDQLLDHVWGNEVYVTPRSVDVHISRLRRMLEKNPQKPEWIKTVRNVGYKFDDAKS